MLVQLDMLHSLRWILHRPVIIIEKDKNVDAVEIVIVVIKENEEEDYVLMMKKLIKTNTKMKVVGY